MTRRTAALLLLLIAVVVFIALVLPARRDKIAAQEEYARAREERQRLRVRLAGLDLGMSEERGAVAADGADAVRALRRAALRATEGLPVSRVAISAGAITGGGAVASRGQIVAEGQFVDTLRLARRLAVPSSGLLIQRITLGEARAGVRLEATAFILREAPR